MHVSAESTFEHIFGFNFHSLGAFAHFVSDLCAVVADVILGVMLGHLLEELLGAVEILLYEDFGMVVWTFCSFLAVAVHVVPA